MVARKQQRITPGCSEIEDPNPCKDHHCKKGKCIPVDKERYECQCRKGWSGVHCEKGSFFIINDYVDMIKFNIYNLNS